MALLEVDDVSVRFGGVVAVDHASFEVEDGAIYGLIGPNGAGKTTLFNVVSGLQEPTTGRVWFDGRDITTLRTQRRARAGLGRTFQRLEVFGSLTVGENVLAAAEMHRSWNRDAEPPARVRDRLLDVVGIAGFADAPSDSIPTGVARLTELARALAADPKLLLLDEPSSGLNEQETREFADLLRTLIREGRSVLLVEHDVDLVMSTCSHVFVLDFGQVIAAGDPAAIQRDPRVQEAYLGADEPNGNGALAVNS